VGIDPGTQKCGKWTDAAVEGFSAMKFPLQFLV
jgi:hypothetical protein